MSQEIVKNLSEIKLPSKELHLAIGMFDGVHLGHQSVIGAALHSAKLENGISGVLTFSPHPSHLFTPDNPTELIMPPVLKYNFLKSLGVEYVFQKEFDMQFAQIEAEDFLPFLKKEFPMLTSVYVGENFKFGHFRKGDVKLLIESGKKLDVDVMSADRINHNGEPISSTRIRKFLGEGAIKEVNHLLGHHYYSELKVIDGETRGRKFGFPTLNMQWNAELEPKFGVYGVILSAQGSEEKWHGVANFGMRPTFGDIARPLIEVHLLEKGKEILFGPGDVLQVEWLHFIRPEMKFDSVDELLKQIASDCTDAERLLG